MKSKSTKIVALLLAVIMVASFAATCLVGCKKNKGDNTEETPQTEAVEVQATSVDYAKDGKYTTTISSDKVSLAGLTAENVEVRYMDASALTVESLSASLEGAAKEPTVEETFPLTATINSVKANASGGYDVSFTDSDAEIFATEYYLVTLKNANAYTYVNVDFPTITLTPDMESVYIGTEQFRVALTIEGAEFEDTLSEDDIYVDKAFEKIDFEIISKSNHSVTLEVKGEFVKSVADTYQWGVIGIKSTGIKNGYSDVEARITVKMDYAGLDATSVSYDGGKVTVNLKVYGVADVDTLNKDDVTIEGTTIEALEKVDGNTVCLTLTVEDIASANDFVDFVKGKTLVLGRYETEILLSQATFYPVFDYIEKDGDNFDITLKLYIYGGNINNTLTADKITLGGDFANGTVKSVTIDADNLATLVLSISCGGFSEDVFQFEGAVTLNAEAVTNAWGEKTSTAYTYSRSYSAETLGREVSLNTDTLLEIQKYTRGQNTTFGNICYWAGNAATVFNVAKSVLEITGVVKSEHQQVMEQLAAMDQKLDNIQSGITDIKKSIGDLVLLTKVLSREEEKRELKNKIDDFEAMLIDFKHTIDVVKAIQKRAAFDMALEEAGVTPNYTGMTQEEITAEKERLRKTYLPDVDAMTNQEAAQYNVKVMNYLNAKVDDSKYSTEYGSYNEYVKDLESTFKNICSSLDKPVASNPISFYDELCSYTYNFDSQTYDFRLANRVAVQYNLTDAISVLAFHFKIAATPDSDRYALIGNAYNKAMNSSIWNASGHPASEIKANPHIAKQSEARIYVSDVKVSGSITSGEEARQYLLDEGYTIIDCDLNAGTAKGCYIFLGYKTTTNFNEAISGLYLGNRSPETVTVEGLGKGYRAPYTGDDFFKAMPGNLNRGCGAGRGIYLYYFKNVEETGIAVSSIQLTKGSSAASRSIPYDGALNGNLNQGAGGYKVYMSISTKGIKDGVDASLVNKMVETDKSYYPYCYTLGCKVSAYITSQGVNNESDIKKTKMWTVEELNEFISRMKHWYLKDEILSSGIKFSPTSNGQPGYSGNAILGYKYVDKWLQNHCVQVYFVWNDRRIDGVNATNKYGTNYPWDQGSIFFIMRY